MSSSTSSLASLHRKALRHLLGPPADPAPRPRHVGGHLTNAGTKRPAPAPAGDDDAVLASLQAELDGLRRRGAFLAGEIERARHCCSVVDDARYQDREEEDDRSPSPTTTWTMTVADELDYVRARVCNDGGHDGGSGKANKMANRPYLHSYDDRDGIGLVKKRRKEEHTGFNISDASAGVTMGASAALIKDGNVKSSALSTKHLPQTNPRNDGEVHVHDVAATLHAMRKRRQIAAAHRLAGISALPLLGGGNSKDGSDNALGVRLDVCLRGEFVGRYHVFFDVVTIRRRAADDANEGMACCNDAGDDKTSTCNAIRLAQHTLPTPGVSVHPILQRNLSPDGMLLLDDEEEDVVSDNSATFAMERIQRCVGEMYDACYAYALRRDACRYLRDMEAGHRGTTGRTSGIGSALDEDGAADYIIAIENFVHNDAFDRVSFEMSFAVGKAKGSRYSIQLCYDNQVMARPTAMRVVLVEGRSADATDAKKKEGSCLPTQENEDGDTKRTAYRASDVSSNLVQEIRDALNTCQIPDAIQKILEMVQR